MRPIDFIKVEEMIETEWTLPNNARTLVICDAEGRVEAVSVEAPGSGPAISFPDKKHFSEILGQGSILTVWVAEQIADTQGRNHYCSETTLDSRYGDETLFIRFEALTLGGELRGFAIHIFPKGAVGSIRSISEGDAVVTKQQWHDIKNRLSVLKLYATLLRKSLPEGEDQKTADKLLNGIDTITRELAEIRRGDIR